jgi:ComF family protein
MKKMTEIDVEKNRMDELGIKDGIDYAYTGWDFDSELRTIIHTLKYEDRARLGFFLELKLGERLSTIRIQHVDGIVPAPLHFVKFRERGYNQAEWIAKGLGEALILPVWSSLIKRVKYTVSQTTLDRQERVENLNRAFLLKKNVIDQGILIVDDVITTGSTISSMATVFKNAGAKMIFAVTLATPKGESND